MGTEDAIAIARLRAPRGVRANNGNKDQEPFLYKDHPGRGEEEFQERHRRDAVGGILGADFGGSATIMRTMCPEKAHTRPPAH